MTVSEEINKIRDKYDPNKGKIKPSHYCRNPYAFSLNECQKCEMCGRRFNEKGELVEDV